MKKAIATALLSLLVWVSALSAATLTVEQPFSFKLTENDSELELEFEHPGNRYLAISVNFAETSSPEGHLRVKGQNEVVVGQASWDKRFDREVFVHNGPVSLIDQMQPVKGRWKIELTGIIAPVSGSLAIVDLGPAPAIEFSNKTGVIQIKKPAEHDFYAVGAAVHPDFPFSTEEFKGSVTADGDVIIPVPVGLYSLRHTSSTVNTMQAHMIPVHADQVTLIENWPAPPQQQSGIDSESAEGGDADSMVIQKEMRIRSAKQLKDEQVQLRFATPHWHGKIAKEELETYESGLKAEVISVKTVEAPLSLTILLDSSGSMKKDMKVALDSVEKFIKMLPEDSEITLVDFDTKAKEIDAKSRAELLKALKGIKADGATCLNDSVMLALKKSEGRDRPAILLFTDGFDANHNDTGPGSKTKPEEMFEAVKAAEVPIFTIGFGAKPDDATLRRLATLSGGQYSKADQKNIAEVFAQTASILGREHELIYRRPGVSGNSDAPVISIVLDVSGSMNLPPTDKGCDYRMEKAKAILRNFINSLPEDAIAQITTYNTYQNVVQVFTGDKIQLLASLSTFEAGGGTETLDTLNVAFKMLKEIPTDRKYLLFITDAGLGLSEDVVDYEVVLGGIKDSGIQTTWVGMVEEADKEPFELAARMCDGKAVVSTDLESISKAIESFGRSIQTASGPADPRIPVQIKFSRRQDNGRMLVMNAANKFLLSAPAIVSRASVNGLKISFAELPPSLNRYNRELSQSLYGNSKTRDETIISDRLPLNISSSNKAIRLTVVEMLMLSKFRGIDLNCAAIKIKLENILPEQDVVVVSGSEGHPASFVGKGARNEKIIKTVPPFMIPNVRNHFFARFNDLNPSPVSDISWLVEEPMVEPEQESILVRPGEPVEGYIVFEFDAGDVIKKVSLKYFDTAYGHIILPIIGVLDLKEEIAQIEKLPESVTASVSEAFQLNLTGFNDMPLPPPHSYDHLTMRVFDLQMVSQIQALLDLNPTERLSLRLPTRFGNLVFKPSDRTATLPMGWHQPVMFLPGSHNYLKQAYVIPTSLKEKVKGTLRLDIAGNEQLLAVGDAEIKAEKPVLSGNGDRIRLDINAFAFENGRAVFDLSLYDDKDGSGTGISVSDLLQVTLGDETISAETDLSDSLFQVVDRVEVADGSSRRFILKMSCPFEAEEKPDFVIKSELFNINYPVINLKEGSIDDYMFCGKDSFTIDDSRRKEILELAAKVHAERQARGIKKKGHSEVTRQSLGSDSGDDEINLPLEGAVLPPPSFSSATSARLQQLLKLTEPDFLAEMRKLQCVPTTQIYQKPVYSAEAVLIQGWGTPSDLLDMAKLYYKTNGILFDKMLKTATLTEEGRQELSKLTGWQREVENLPVLSVGKRNLVVPFFKEAAEIKNLVSAVSENDYKYSSDRTVSIRIYLVARPRPSNQAGMFGSMGSAMGGGDSDATELLTVLNTEEVDLALCSRAPIDIFYFTSDNGNSIYAIAEGAAGRLPNIAPALSLLDHEILEEIIEISYYNEKLTYSRKLAENTSITDTFRTIAIAMPDVPEAASEMLAKEFESRKTADAPGTKSTLKWFSHAKIYQFLALHSAAEKEAIEKTGVKAARSDNRMRTIILTLAGSKEGLRALFDLRQINPEVHGEDKAIKAFNFYMGIANTMIEEQIMGGGGLFSRWQAAPDQQIVVAGPEDISSLIDGLDPELISEETLKALSNSAYDKNLSINLGVIIALKAPMIGEKLRPAWFTFNPETYEMISVLDNGAHGAMVEKPITEIISDAAKYSVGFMIGVNTSVWAVAGYSLKYADLRQIAKAAKALCLGIAAQVGNIGKPLTEFIPTSYTAHEAKASAGRAEVKIGFGEIKPDGAKLMTKPSLSFNLTYQTGFEDAVKAYFGDN